MLIYPAAFNMTTGPLHWELLQRARANDLQLFVATISPGNMRRSHWRNINIVWKCILTFYFSTARDVSSEYVAWGHSMVVDPWAKIIKSAQDGEETIVADLGKILKSIQILIQFCLFVVFIINFSSCRHS